MSEQRRYPAASLLAFMREAFSACGVPDAAIEVTSGGRAATERIMDADPIEPLVSVAVAVTVKAPIVL